MVQDIVVEFKNYILQIGYSKGSQYQIPNCIKEFIEQIDKPIIEINQHDILEFYKYLQTRPLKRRTGALSEAMINHYIFALKTFFNWLESTGQLTYNPISNLKFKRPKANTRQPLSQEELLQLFESAENSKEIAILHLFYSCGLRRTEAEHLNTTDIHFTQNLVYVRQGKGAKRRVIPINEKVKIDLLNYQTSKSKNEINEAFILNTRGKRMSGESYNKLVKRIVSNSKLDKEISLHHLRHSIATHLLENGMNIEFVRDFLGHTHLEATQIYTKVNLDNVKFTNVAMK